MSDGSPGALLTDEPRRPQLPHGPRLPEVTHRTFGTLDIFSKRDMTHASLQNRTICPISKKLDVILARSLL